MARGFESKSVASQQESAFGEMDRERRAVDPQLQERRRRLVLTRADLRRQLAAARAEAHRVTLQRALEAVEGELATLPPEPG